SPPPPPSPTLPVAGPAERSTRMATTRPTSNIEIIWSDWLDAGVRPDMICPDRESVLANARNRSEELPDVGAIELVAAGDHVVLSVRAPSVGMPLDDDSPMRGQ